MVSVNCVQCGRSIPSTSKLADLTLRASEAESQSWAFSPNPDGTATVKMCLQCQINRSERQKRGEATGFKVGA